MKYLLQTSSLISALLLTACNEAAVPKTSSRDGNPSAGTGEGTSKTDSTADSSGNPNTTLPTPAATPATPNPTTTPDPTPSIPTAGSWYKPALAVTWQWQLTGTINTGYAAEIYDIDLFDTSAQTVSDLKSKGHKIICYFSAGSSEDWRPDYASIDAASKGSNLDGWPGEKWLDIRSANVLKLFTSRLDLAVSKGCDGVEPDNVDGYSNKSGFPLTAADQLAFNKKMAEEAHKRGLAIALKNDLDQVEALVGFFDFSVNEQCQEYKECDLLQPFIKAGKPVLNAEYKKANATALCTSGNSLKMRTLVLPLDLNDSFRISCF